MALLAHLFQHVENTGFGTYQCIFRDTDFLCDPVSNDKTNAKYVACQPIRVFPHNPDGILTVLFEYLRAIAGAHPVSLEKDHNIPDLSLIFPCLADHLEPLLANPFHTEKIFRTMFNDLQGLVTEPLYQTPGHLRTDSPDEP